MASTQNSVLLQRGLLTLGASELEGCVLRFSVETPEGEGGQFALKVVDIYEGGHRVQLVRFKRKLILDLRESNLLQTPFDAVVIAIAYPWDHLVMPKDTPTRRTFIVSASLWHTDIWHDGPLAHVLPDGHVGSYLPAGGDAALRVPFALDPALRGLSYKEARALEGSASERAQRCVLAQLRARLTPLGTKALVFQDTDFSRRDAVLLALIRQAFPEAIISLVTASQPKDWPPPFRRFCENTRITFKAQVAGSPIPLASLHNAFAPTLTEDLIAEINKISAVLPLSLVTH